MKFIVLLTFISFNFFFCSASPNITEKLPNNLIQASESYLFKSKTFLYLQTEKNALSISEFNHNSALFEKFQLYTKDTPNFGFTTDDIWILLKVSNSEKSEINAYFSFSNPMLDIIELYTYSGGLKKITTTGDQINYHKRPVKDRNLLLPISIQGNQTKIYLIKLNNNGDQFHFNLSYKPHQQVVKGNYFDQFFFGIYFGILIFVLIFNVFMYILMQDKTSRYYVFYILSLGILQLSLNGFGNQYLWTENPFLSNHMNPITASLGVFFLILFAISFLNLNHYLAKTSKILKLTAWAILANSFIAFIPSDFCYHFSILFVNVATFGMAIAIIPISIIVVRKKYKPARFFGLAFVALLIAVMIFVLRNFGIFPSNSFTNYGLQYGSTFEVILLSIAIIDRFRDIKETAFERLNEINEMRLNANIELEKKVAERTSEVNQQKNQIETQNEEILSSIEYAKRIQNALLPSEHSIMLNIKNSFILFKPKDIVSGDFYWLEKVGNAVYFAAADCTGHGVPGAMVSVICANALSKALLEENITETGKLLDRTRELVVEKFAGSGEDVKDGMDISLCKLEVNKLQWSGANNPLWIIRNSDMLTSDKFTERSRSEQDRSKHNNNNKEEVERSQRHLEEIKADKQPIGKTDNPQPFTTHDIELNKGDTFYIFTDGYADQFGGEKGKKFKYKPMKDLLLSIQDKTLEEQKTTLNNSFEDWKGNLEQVDDVCVIAVKL